MKLSEAIREGAKLRPQTTGRYFRQEGNQICSCALGAAFEATQGSTAIYDEGNGGDVLDALFPALNKPFKKALPKGIDESVFKSERFLTLGRLITKLNDYFKWNREQIADWLEQQGF